MNSIHVLQQITLLIKAHVTIFNGAHKRLLVCVDAQMGVEFAQASE